MHAMTGNVLILGNLIGWQTDGRQSSVETCGDSSEMVAADDQGIQPKRHR